MYYSAHILQLSLGMSPVTMPQTMEWHYKNSRAYTRLNIMKCFPGGSAKSSKFYHHPNSLIIHYLSSCLAHIINLATQSLISTYSKVQYYNPHEPRSHEPTTWDEIGLIRSICVKVCLLLSYNLYIDVLQERSSAKRKEMYRSVQIKAGVSQLTQLLIDMKVWWSSTYIMLNCAERNKEVRILILY